MKVAATPMLAGIAFLSAVQNVTATNSRNASCLPKFDLNREEYASCLGRPCLLFKDSPPLTKFDGQGALPPSQKPFPCRSRSSMYPGLSGIIFQIVDEIPAIRDHALCIFAGNECSYDDLVHVLEDTAKAGPYKFITIDCLFRLSYRLTSFAIPSVPYMNDKVVIYGLQEYAPFDQGQTVWAALLALSPEAWMAVSVILFVLFFCRSWIMLEYRTAPTDPSAPFDWKKFLFYMFGAFDPIPTATEAHSTLTEETGSEDEDTGSPLGSAVKESVEDEEKKRETLLFLNWLLLWVTGAFVAINVIFYELGIVNFIFNSKRNYDKPLENLSDEELARFAVVRNSASEYIFRLLSSPKKPLWSSFDTSKQVLAAIRDSSHPARYALTYSQFAKYFLDSQRACDEFAIFDMRNRVLRPDAVWFYSTHVSRELRHAIDLRITQLVEAGRVAEMIRGQVPPEEHPCGDVKGSITWVAMLGPNLLLMPCILGMIIFLIARRIRRMNSAMVDRSI